MAVGIFRLGPYPYSVASRSFDLKIAMRFSRPILGEIRTQEDLLAVIQALSVPKRNKLALIGFALAGFSMVIAAIAGGFVMGKFGRREWNAHECMGGLSRWGDRRPVFRSLGRNLVANISSGIFPASLSPRAWSGDRPKVGTTDGRQGFSVRGAGTCSA